MMDSKLTNAPEVVQWDRFEVELVHPHTYADPYRDVKLWVDYTRPDGTPVSFWGFYDGDATWRLRFMPDQTGRWQYAARFSDGSAGCQGAFTCVPGDLPGMISRDEANPAWFGFRGGGHGMVRSLHVGDAFFAANLDADRRTAFLDWAGAQGYTMLSVASHYLNRDAPGRGQGWATPRLWPLDAAAYRQLERVLDDLASRRMAVFPFAGFFGRDAAYPRDPAEQELYVRYTLARLGPYWNVLLNVAGPEPLLPNHPFMDRDEVVRLGRLIHALDVFDHPLTVHNPTGDDAFVDEDWLTFTTLQGPKTTDLVALSQGVLRNHHPEKPLYAQETLWSGNQYHPDYSDRALRKNAFVLLMSAATINFADNGGPVPGATGDSSSGFSGSLDLADRRQARHDILRRVWDCVAAFPFYRMAPRQDLVSRGYCLAEAGVHYLVYLPEGGGVDVTVPPGVYSILWIDGRDPTIRAASGTTSDGQNLASPEGGDDWLLYLHRPS